MSISFNVCVGDQLLQDMREDEYGPFNALELNLSNRNARILLETVGVPMNDCCGTITDVADLERRCMDVLNALRACPELDRGRTHVEGIGAAGARWVDCALPDDYLQRRVGELRELAERALLEGGVITFG